MRERIISSEMSSQKKKSAPSASIIYPSALRFASPHFFSPFANSEYCIPRGVRCVTTPGQSRATMAQWSDQFESSKKSMSPYLETEAFYLGRISSSKLQEMKAVGCRLTRVEALASRSFVLEDSISTRLGTPRPSRRG